MITRPITAIHEIEFSSMCNLACRYCPHPKLEREKAHMSAEVFERTLEHLEHYRKVGTQGEVSLTGLGEAVLHPRFVEMATAVRALLGPYAQVVMATNGVKMTPALAGKIASLGIIVYVSTHRPERAALAYEMLREAGCVLGINTHFVNASFDWAGQVKWPVSAARVPCEYLKNGWAVVRQCGHVDACCLDAHDKYPIGAVNDPLGSWRTHITGLCSTCHMEPPLALREGVAA